MSLTQERRLLDQNSSKHEDSYSELGGHVFTLKFGNFITNGSLWKKADDLNNIELKTEKIIYIIVAKYESLFNIWQRATHQMHHVRLAG